MLQEPTAEPVGRMARIRAQVNVINELVDDMCVSSLAAVRGDDEPAAVAVNSLSLLNINTHIIIIIIIIIACRSDLSCLVFLMCCCLCSCVLFFAGGYR